MRIYNKYIVSLVLVSILINISLYLFGQNQLEIYLFANIITYLAITLIYSYINPGARRALNTLGAVYFAGFMVLISLKVVEIILG